MEWCEMRVVFYGDKETRIRLAEAFKGLEQSELVQSPPFIMGWRYNYRNLLWSDSEEVLYYEYKDKPNLEELVALADFHRCSFECTYKLPTSKVFCRVHYRDGILSSPAEIKPAEDSREITVIDLEGKEKRITDLEQAIALTAEFMDYEHEDKSFGAFDEKMRRYWTDLHSKLTAIKNSSNNQNDIEHEKP